MMRECSEVRHGNSNMERQLRRDIDQLKKAIVQCGHLESDRVKAHTLLKSSLLLYFGNLSYRDLKDRLFHPWCELSHYLASDSGLNAFPIAAALLHGSRVLIGFPKEVGDLLLDWFIVDKMNWRYIATHTIAVLSEPEALESGLKKCLKEEKMSNVGAAAKLFSNSLYSMVSTTVGAIKNLVKTSNIEKETEDSDNVLNSMEHYGIDLALGGAENPHFFSKNIISNNGENGHLYANFYMAKNAKEHSGLLVAVEQSAPGKPDQYGGSHDTMASAKEYSASGGDFYCKEPKNLGDAAASYQGLTKLPIADYYDSFWNFISGDTFNLVKESYRKCEVLLNLLTEEESMQFIDQIVSSAGGCSKDDFQKLYHAYLIKSPEVKNYLSKKDEQLEMLDKQYHEVLEEKDQLLGRYYADTIINQYDIAAQQAFPLAKEFMGNVIKNMGWFSSNSRKKILLTELKTQLDSDEKVGSISIGRLTWLLRNFIGVALMNRYTRKACETCSGKACLDLLNLPYYRALKEVLFQVLLPVDRQPAQLEYKDLLHLLSERVEIYNGSTFYSAAYKQDLYQFYKLEGSAKQVKLSSEIAELAMKELIYKPKISPVNTYSP